MLPVAVETVKHSSSNVTSETRDLDRGFRIGLLSCLLEIALKLLGTGGRELGQGTGAGNWGQQTELGRGKWRLGAGNWDRELHTGRGPCHKGCGSMAAAKAAVKAWTLAVPAGKFPSTSGNMASLLQVCIVHTLCKRAASTWRAPGMPCVAC